MKLHRKKPDYWEMIEVANEGGRLLEDHCKRCGICRYGKYCEESMKIFRQSVAKGKKLWERIKRNRKVRV